MPANSADARWLDAAAALARRASPLSRPNPAVGALIVKDGVVIGRGWTAPGGRPHAEARALEQAGMAAKGATAYVTLEPCAHDSERGPACADLLVQARVARVVIGMRDPDPRTAGKGAARLEDAGIAVQFIASLAAARSLEGYLHRQRHGRPHVTLKIAMSMDGCIALADGSSRWITGEAARAHTHALRARCDGIVVGGGTLRADAPRLDVRLPGMKDRSPARYVLSRKQAPEGWHRIVAPEDIFTLGSPQSLLLEGGAGAAAAFLRADLVDRICIYRAPIIIGSGLAGIGDIGLSDLADAHGRWAHIDTRMLGTDTLEVYERA